jgi:heme/copper-type cytochrome/quinol oxidase subunit 2
MDFDWWISYFSLLFFFSGLIVCFWSKRANKWNGDPPHPPWELMATLNIIFFPIFMVFCLAFLAVKLNFKIWQSILAKEWCPRKKDL